MLAVITAGFFGGVSRAVSAIIAVYLAAISAGAFYEELTDATRRLVNMGKSTGELAYFVLTFLTFSLVLTFVISRLLDGLALPRRLGVLDRIRGTAIGVLGAGAAVTVAALLLSVLVQALQQISMHGHGPLVNLVHDQVRNSALVPIFLHLSPYFIHLFEPWFPGGLPQLLASVS